jgi:hypothetical protein
MSAYGTMRASGRITYPVAKIEAGRAKIQALIEGNKAAQEVQEIVGNISIGELNEIIAKVQECSKDGSISAADAQEIGVMLFEAVKSK